MYRDLISLEEALLLEEKEQIIIYNPNIVDSLLSYVNEWKENWDFLRKKYRHIDISKLSDFANFAYLIEYKFIEDDNPNIINWVYMYGQDVESKLKLEQSYYRGQYVYILTNIAYPGMVKIGKAVNPQKRIRQINNAGVIIEWELKWALPVSDDYKVEKLIHDDLRLIRKSTYQGSDREFFEISLEEAKTRILYLAKNFITGEPINY
jgi:hypothetical protein